jgi:complement component 1 Q subcomponent-binding protein
VEDRSGEQWMIMRGKYDDIEDVKLEVTMFDGYVTVPKLGDDASGEDVRLHISFIVDVSKGDGGENLEFLCSAWPDRLEIQKVYLLRGEKMPGRPYMGPDFRCGPFFFFSLWCLCLICFAISVCLVG